MHFEQELFYRTFYYAQTIESVIRAGLRGTRFILRESDMDLAFCYACKYGQLEIAQFLLDAGVELHKKSNAAHLLASSKGHLHIIQLLMDQGSHYADVDLMLYMAVTRNHPAVVQYLLRNSAQYLPIQECLGLAVEKGFVEITQLLTDVCGLSHTPSGLSTSRTDTLVHHRLSTTNSTPPSPESHPLL